MKISLIPLFSRPCRAAEQRFPETQSVRGDTGGWQVSPEDRHAEEHESPAMGPGVDHSCHACIYTTVSSARPFQLSKGHCAGREDSLRCRVAEEAKGESNGELYPVHVSDQGQ